MQVIIRYIASDSVHDAMTNIIRKSSMNLDNSVYMHIIGYSQEDSYNIREIQLIMTPNCWIPFREWLDSLEKDNIIALHSVEAEL